MPRAKAACSSRDLVIKQLGEFVIDPIAKWNRESKDANSYQETRRGTISAKGSGGRYQPRNQSREGRQEPVIRGAGRGRRSQCSGGRLWFREGEGSSASHPQGH